MKTVRLAAMAMLAVPAGAGAVDYTMLAGGEGTRGGFVVCSDAATPAEAPRTAFFPNDRGDVLIHRDSDGRFYFLTSGPRDIARQTSSGVIDPAHPVLLDLHRACGTHHPREVDDAKTRLEAFRIAAPPGKQPGDGGWKAITSRLKADGFL